MGSWGDQTKQAIPQLNEQIFPKGITGDFFERIQTKAVFIEEVKHDFYRVAGQYGLEPHFSPSHLQDAFFCWTEDIKRIEFDLGRAERIEGKKQRADHIKCAAHLMFWLARSSPVNEFAHDGVITPTRSFMLKYGREYLALDFAYRAAQFYECEIRGVDPKKSFSLHSDLKDAKPNEFIEDAAQTLKLHILSPHSLIMTLRAIFLRA